MREFTEFDSLPYERMLGQVKPSIFIDLLILNKDDKEMSKSKEKEKSFLSRHGSVFFLAGVFLLGFILIPSGLYFQQSESAILSGLGVVLLQFSGALIAVALTAFAFNLPDLREYMAGTVATLFTRGEIVPILSTPTKEVLQKRLWLDLTSEEVLDVEPTLYGYLNKLAKCCFESPYVTNYHYALGLSESKEEKAFLFVHSVLSYRLHVHHLDTANIRLPFRYFRQESFPKEAAPKIEEWLSNFKLDVGDQEFTIDDINREQEESGDIVHFRAIFEKEIKILQDVDVNIIVDMLRVREDPIEITYARYPSQGFHVTLSFDEKNTYDHGWFTHCDPADDVSLRRRVDLLPNGISARTNEWVLPGEGVAIYYYPKD